MEQKRAYSESFKRMVIEEHLCTGCTKTSLLAKYEIRFTGAIQTWMKQMGYTQTGGVGRLKFGGIIGPTLAKDDNKQTQEDLQKRIRELERQLEDEKLRSEAFVRIIEKAEKELKIPIRKKPSTK
jgi:transposase